MCVLDAIDIIKHIRIQMLGERFLTLLIELAEDQDKQSKEVVKKGNSDVRLGADYIRNNRINNVMSQLKEEIAHDQKNIIRGPNEAETFDNIYYAIPTDMNEISTHEENIAKCFHVCDSLTQPTQNLIREYCQWIINRSLNGHCVYDGLKKLDAFYQEHRADNWESYILKQNKFV